jgi:GTPase SAR1 family protein
MHEIERSILIVGKTGAGKSWVLNKLLDKNYFKSSANTQSCSDKVESVSSLVRGNFELNSNETCFQLKAFDTPGIGDSQGRSKEFLNEIAKTIKTTPLNLLIILVEYGRLDLGLYNNLEILRECLNGLAQSSSMLIVNKVPTEKYLDRKRKRGEEVHNRNEVMNEMFEKLSLALGNEFKFKIYLENEDLDENINEVKYDLIRTIIYTRTLYLNTSKVKTWNEIVAFYTSEIESDQKALNRQMKEFEEETKNRLDKIDLDISDLFKDEKHQLSYVSVSEEIDLKEKRNELRRELSLNEIEERKKLLQIKKNKLIRLDATLVNPLQIRD